MTADRVPAETKPWTVPPGDEGPRRVGRSGRDFVIDAALIGDLLGVPAADVPALMRGGSITGVCERGAGADQGTFRLSLFHRGRRGRLRIDAAGRILQRSVVDFGERPPPRRRRRPRQTSFHAMKGQPT